MRTKKVLTITLNPALDLTGSLANLNVGAVSLVSQGSLHAAGKGVNVARILSELGAEVTVTGFLGQENQGAFVNLFSQLPVIDKFIRVGGATRTNVKLVEQNGTVSDINFPGVSISAEAIEQFEKSLVVLMEDHHYFVMAGSLPEGLSPQHCTRWIKMLSDAGKKVFFDSSREVLSAGLEASPWFIKPNDEELSYLLGRELASFEACHAAALSLPTKGIDHIVVSMGERGLIWLNREGCLCSQPPKVAVRSTVGAGDTLVAGFCWGMMQEMSKPDLLRLATALSAHAVSLVGVAVPNPERLSELLQEVKLSQFP